MGDVFQSNRRNRKNGKNNGRNMSAIITDMNTPLGKNIGNSLEVIESIEFLKGKSDLQWYANR